MTAALQPGDVVRQHVSGSRYDYATVNRAYPWGGIDVLMGGRVYGWSSSVCELVRRANGEYVLNQPKDKA